MRRRGLENLHLQASRWTAVLSISPDAAIVCVFASLVGRTFVFFFLIFLNFTNIPELY